MESARFFALIFCLFGCLAGFAPHAYTVKEGGLPLTLVNGFLSLFMGQSKRQALMVNLTSSCLDRIRTDPQFPNYTSNVGNGQALKIVFSTAKAKDDCDRLLSKVITETTASETEARKLVESVRSFARAMRETYGQDRAEYESYKRFAREAAQAGVKMTRAGEIDVLERFLIPASRKFTLDASSLLFYRASEGMKGGTLAFADADDARKASQADRYGMRDVMLQLFEGKKPPGTRSPVVFDYTLDSLARSPVQRKGSLEDCLRDTLTFNDKLNCYVRAANVLPRAAFEAAVGKLPANSPANQQTIAAMRKALVETDVGAPVSQVTANVAGNLVDQKLRDAAQATSGDTGQAIARLREQVVPAVRQEAAEVTREMTGNDGKNWLEGSAAIAKDPTPLVPETVQRVAAKPETRRALAEVLASLPVTASGKGFDPAALARALGVWFGFEKERPGDAARTVTFADPGASSKTKTINFNTCLERHRSPSDCVRAFIDRSLEPIAAWVKANAPDDGTALSKSIRAALERAYAKLKAAHGTRSSREELEGFLLDVQQSMVLELAERAKETLRSGEPSPNRDARLAKLDALAQETNEALARSMREYTQRLLPSTKSSAANVAKAATESAAEFFGTPVAVTSINVLGSPAIRESLADLAVQSLPVADPQTAKRELAGGLDRLLEPVLQCLKRAEADPRSVGAVDCLKRAYLAIGEPALEEAARNFWLLSGNPSHRVARAVQAAAQEVYAGPRQGTERERLDRVLVLAQKKALGASGEFLRDVFNPNRLPEGSTAATRAEQAQAFASVLSDSVDAHWPAFSHEAFGDRSTVTEALVSAVDNTSLQAENPNASVHRYLDSVAQDPKVRNAAAGLVGSLMLGADAIAPFQAAVQESAKPPGERDRTKLSSPFFRDLAEGFLRSPEILRPRNISTYYEDLDKHGLSEATATTAAPLIEEILHQAQCSVGELAVAPVQGSATGYSAQLPRASLPCGCETRGGQIAVPMAGSFPGKLIFSDEVAQLIRILRAAWSPACAPTIEKVIRGLPDTMRAQTSFFKNPISFLGSAITASQSESPSLLSCIAIGEVQKKVFPKLRQALGAVPDSNGFPFLNAVLEERTLHKLIASDPAVRAVAERATRDIAGTFTPDGVRENLKASVARGAGLLAEALLRSKPASTALALELATQPALNPLDVVKRSSNRLDAFLYSKMGGIAQVPSGQAAAIYDAQDNASLRQAGTAITEDIAREAGQFTERALVLKFRGEEKSAEDLRACGPGKDSPLNLLSLFEDSPQAREAGETNVCRMKNLKAVVETGRKLGDADGSSAKYLALREELENHPSTLISRLADYRKRFQQAVPVPATSSYVVPMN